MNILAYISLGFTGIQFINVLLNLLFRQKLRSNDSKIEHQVSILIPARNEEKNIDHLLVNLIKNKSSNLEIIVYDDESTDNTAKVLTSYAKLDSRIKTVKTQKLPEGWLGKNHACYQLAQHAKGKYLLFIDADVEIESQLLNDVISKITQSNLALLSIFPTQIIQTWGEKATVPIMNYILLSLLPLIFVRYSPFSSHAAANGQFMLFDAQIYKKYQPHLHFKSSAIEDIKIARFLKRSKEKIACLTGDSRIRCRMYNNYNEALNGFAKNVFMFFGNQAIIGFLYAIFNLLGFIPVLSLGIEWVLIYFIVLILNQVFISIVSKEKIALNLLLLPIQFTFLIQVLVKASIIKRTKVHQWKERNIYLS